ncbi:hypothetical protein BSF41_46030 [Flavobacterium sp. ACN2]|nr:hypothetical protein BSF41_46030 [Flavobacterium sp. ACN2]
MASPYVVNANLPEQTTDEYTAGANQTEFILAAAPVSISKVRMYINGVRIDKEAISVSGTTVTYKPVSNGGYALMADDNVMIDYLK